MGISGNISHENKGGIMMKKKELKNSEKGSVPAVIPMEYEVVEL